jgi:hypothetical protein
VKNKIVMTAWRELDVPWPAPRPKQPKRAPARHERIVRAAVKAFEKAKRK